MITLEWLSNTEAQLKDPRDKAIFKVLSDSYKHWNSLSCQQHSWPYDEEVRDRKWDCEVALLAFTRL